VNERVTGERDRKEVLRENKGMMEVRSEGIFLYLGETDTHCLKGC